MLILNAEGKSGQQHASWDIGAGTPMFLGRNTDNDCSVPWDKSISRNHAELTLTGDVLTVRCLPRSRNLIHKNGLAKIQAEVLPGESFKIGDTRFTLELRTPTNPAVSIIAQGVSSDSNTTSLLMNPADVRMALVSESAASLWTSADEQDLARRALEVLSTALAGADLLVVLTCKDIQSASRPKIVHWHKEASGVQAVVSRELIAKALGQSETAIQVQLDILGDPTEEGRWAFCVPIRSTAASPWCIYVGGTFGKSDDYGPFLSPEKLKPDAGVTELVAHLMGAIRSVRSLESRFDGMRSFFSPSLLSTIASSDATSDSLAPRETDVVAIYCDLRGFSRMVAKGSSDLHGLLARISGALGVMTENIIDQQGAIADFQGDSALGFWGWPLALANGPIPAIRAALKIQRVFEEAAKSRHSELSGFQVGIGIATGRAIAGRIGTRDHAKIGIFGPVVNVASRLEGLTKKTGASILLDEATAVAAASSLHPDEGRCRPIGSLQPVGFEQPINVTELLPPEDESSVSNADIENFTDAVIAFKAGEWDRSHKLLGLLPGQDRTKDFLLVQIASANYQAPIDWDGVIRMTSK